MMATYAILKQIGSTLDIPALNSLVPVCIALPRIRHVHPTHQVFIVELDGKAAEDEFLGSFNQMVTTTVKVRPRDVTPEAMPAFLSKYALKIFETPAANTVKPTAQVVAVAVKKEEPVEVSEGDDWIETEESIDG
jgi:hypothetical protein